MYIKYYYFKYMSEYTINIYTLNLQFPLIHETRIR